MAGESVPVLLPWEPSLPRPPGAPRHEEIYPFQAMEELTAQDIQWLTVMRVASWGLEDVQQFLCISIERLNSGISSRGDPGVPTKARASQTQV